jgi:hypothetical protein
MKALSSSSEQRSLRLKVRSRGEKENTRPLMDQAHGEAAIKKCKSKHAEEVVNRLETAKKIREAEEVIKRRKAEIAKGDELILKARVVEAEAHRKLLLANAKESELCDAWQQLNATQQLVSEATSRLDELNNKIEDSQRIIFECDKELKSKKQLNRYYDKVPVITSRDEVIQLAAVIEGALCHLKGKHNSTKAKLLMEAIVTGNLFQGEAAKMMNEKSGLIFRIYFVRGD